MKLQERNMRHVLIAISAHPALPAMPSSKTALQEAVLTADRRLRCNADTAASCLARSASYMGEDFGEHLDRVHDLLTEFAEAAEACGIRWWEVSP